MRFVDQVVIVTGAARGMGAAQAERFASEGAAVVVADIDTTGAGRLAASLGGRSRSITLDVADATSWSDAIASTVADLGRIDVLVNNAGISVYRPLAETDLESFTAQIAVNQIGVFLGMNAVLDTMRSQGGGAIVNITSGAATKGVENMAAYSATKAAAWALTQVAAREWGPYGIRVNAVQPGVIDTQMTSAVSDVDVDAMMAANPIPRMGRVDEIAAAVAYLASSDASYITGISVMVDGGRTSAVPKTPRQPS